MSELEHVAHPWSCFLDGSEEGRLVADLKNDVIESIDLLNDLAHIRSFSFDQNRILQCLCILVTIAADTVDIVLVIERAQRPGVVVLTVKKADLHHNAVFGSLADEVFQAIEVRWIPMIQIELVPGKQVAGLIAAGPRKDELCGLHAQRVPGHEFTHWLEQVSRIDARVVKPISLEGVQVRDVVEFPIHDGAVVLGRGDQDRGLSLKEIVVRVRRIDADGLRLGSHCQKEQDEGRRSDHDRPWDKHRWRAYFEASSTRTQSPSPARLFPGGVNCLVPWFGNDCSAIEV